MVNLNRNKWDKWNERLRRMKTAGVDVKPQPKKGSWKYLRMVIRETFPPICMKCGAVDKETHIDHIKPKSKYKKEIFNFNNLQILCATCNVIKSNKDFTDYRSMKQKERARNIFINDLRLQCIYRTSLDRIYKGE